MIEFTWTNAKATLLSPFYPLWKFFCQVRKTFKKRKKKNGKTWALHSKMQRSFQQNLLLDLIWSLVAAEPLIPSCSISTYHKQTCIWSPPSSIYLHRPTTITPVPLATATTRSQTWFEEMGQREICCYCLIMLMFFQSQFFCCFAEGSGIFARLKTGLFSSSSSSQLVPSKSKSGFGGAGEALGSDKRKVYTGSNPLHNR